jgi:hypothetical protein
MLKSCDPEHQDAAAMYTTVMLINQIRTSDKERLSKAYGTKFDQYQTTLTMWLETMDDLIEIRNMMGFEGDKTERTMFFDGLSDEQFELEANETARIKICHAADKVNQLRWTDDFTVARFSEELACIFLRLIEWDSMRKTYLEKLLDKFNNRLLIWF